MYHADVYLNAGRSPHSVAGDYFAAAPETYLPTPAGPATYREALCGNQILVAVGAMLSP